MLKENFDLIELFLLDDNSYSEGRKDSTIKAIIIHSLGQNVIKAIKLFNELGVSAHYFIPQETGENILAKLPIIYADLGQKEPPIPKLLYPDKVPVIQLVQDKDRAYHAGLSKFGSLNKEINSTKSLNYISLGIEFESPGYGKEGEDFYHFSSFSEGQKETGLALIEKLVKEYSIPQRNLLAHSTIAVGRKTDPGPNFFWQDLNKAGLLPLPILFDKGNKIMNLDQDLIFNIQKQLEKIGFIDCPTNGLLDEMTRKHLDAYILQFASNLWEGPNNEISEGLLASLESCLEIFTAYQE